MHLLGSRNANRSELLVVVETLYKSKNFEYATESHCAPSLKQEIVALLWFLVLIRIFKG